MNLLGAAEVVFHMSVFSFSFCFLSSHLPCAARHGEVGRGSQDFLLLISACAGDAITLSAEGRKGDMVCMVAVLGSLFQSHRSQPYQTCLIPGNAREISWLPALGFGRDFSYLAKLANWIVGYLTFSTAFRMSGLGGWKTEKLQ